MRTALIIGGGLLLLGVFVLAARWLGGPGNVPIANAAKIFILIWLVVALLNMWIGVAQAGYAFQEELPIFLLIFLLPAAAAVFIKWQFP